ncbi:ATP-dependent Lon protease pim1 [Coelomomyces lativittatus]|nr:ATP-dependent Lon protease pim1 [Coelomomyces lativittatus]KAJ1514489.1 ATP-dependent Lon protease pim1 [Coelomomyces lativittatus]KAJ1518147.1 ATP-dependent Lon protease pim1 [Coelomomyces lativittatus]
MYSHHPKVISSLKTSTWLKKFTYPYHHSYHPFKCSFLSSIPWTSTSPLYSSFRSLSLRPFFSTTSPNASSTLTQPPSTSITSSLFRISSEKPTLFPCIHHSSKRHLHSLLQPFSLQKKRFPLKFHVPRSSSLPFFHSTSSFSSSSSSSSAPPDDNESNLQDQVDQEALPPNEPETHLQTLSPLQPFSPILALPITRRPLFPGFYKTVMVKDPDVVKAIKEIGRSSHPYVTAVLLKNEDADTDHVTSLEAIYRVGVFCQISNYFVHSEDPNTLTVILYPHQRVRILDFAPTHPSLPSSSSNPSTTALETLNSQPEHTEVTKNSKGIELNAIHPSVSSPHSSLLQKYKVTRVMTETMPDEKYKKDNQLIRALTSEIVSVLKDIATLNPIFRDQIAAFSVSHASASIFDDPSKLADFAAAVSGGSHSDELQSVLDSVVIEERLQKALYVLKKELVNAQLQSKLSKEIESKIQKRQREYYLMEQLKSIKKELGLESDGKDKLLEKFKQKLEKLTLPDHVRSVVDEELQKLSYLDPAASEFNVTRNYVDWLTSLPWGQQSQDQLDLPRARVILDEDHYGLKDVKERILEFIAIGKLKGTVQGKILCFVGPPGVGKTSIGKSIARALNRPFFRFSVGGLADVAEIKGHRRTYVGAMPGKLVQAMKQVQSENPLILIDEIDKLGRGGVHGDPASALLEVLDPEQNTQFVDHYLDVPMDLSKVMFVCTANLTDTIPGPLLDRMEVIQLSGYIADEKLAIASTYLAPQAQTACGLDASKVTLETNALELLIRSYCRESGVRNLKKHIEKVYRKAAYQWVQHEEDAKASPLAPIRINETNLKDFVGSAPFSSERLFDITPPGVVMGLAWTAMGGSALYIESVVESTLSGNKNLTRGGGGGASFFQKTGKLGEVMQESATLAYTFARTFYEAKFPDSDYFDSHRIHLHVPEGATPKDGPSAGITMATSILSLALNQKVTVDLAMTGELTLSGKVLKIGGLKEKAIAAKRSGVKTIVFPKANESDWLELPEIVKEGLNPIMVDWYEEVFDVCFSKEGK